MADCGQLRAEIQKNAFPNTSLTLYIYSKLVLLQPCVHANARIFSTTKRKINFSQPPATFQILDPAANLQTLYMTPFTDYTQSFR